MTTLADLRREVKARVPHGIIIVNGPGNVFGTGRVHPFQVSVGIDSRRGKTADRRTWAGEGTTRSAALDDLIAKLPGDETRCGQCGAHLGGCHHEERAIR